MSTTQWFVLLCCTICLNSALKWTNPYDGPEGASFWDDIQLVHKATKRLRTPRYHGASRPFFETITNALSDAEKAAFSRLSQGILPDSGLSVDEAPPANIPIYYKPCGHPELEGLGTSLMQLEVMNVTLDPRHVKMKVDVVANLLEGLNSNLTHHTVVTVDDVSVGGFEMSPMVLYDKTGPICDMFDDVLGCPIAKGPLRLAKKVRIPGLDAVTSLPKRLYNSHVNIFEGDSLVTCMHLYMDLRTEEERKLKPLSDVTPITPEEEEIKYQKLIQTQSVSTENCTTPSTVEVVMPGMTPVTQTTPEKSALLPLPSGPKSEASAAEDGSTAPLGLLRSVINLQSAAAASKPKTPQQQEDTALLQQLQLKNLQEQLQLQLDINKKQKVEYEELKSKLQRLEPSEIDHLKATVNELLSIQRSEAEERLKQQQNALREQELYQHLHSLYENYGLPTSSLPFGGVSQPLVPRLNSFDRLGEIQFLNQIDKNLVESDTPAVLPRRVSPTQSNEHNVEEKPAEVLPTKGVADNSAQVKTVPPVGSESAPAVNDTATSVPSATATQMSESETPALAMDANATAASPAATTTPNAELLKERFPAMYQAQDDSDLPDISNILASSPTFSDNDFGVSYVATKLDDYVRDLCVPFVTLASDLSFSFCKPENWGGLLAVVVTDPFTAEKGIFADKTSMSQPYHYNTAPDPSDQKYYAQPQFVGMNEILLGHKYATIVVSFNADTFVAGLPYFTTEIMGAYAAFVDYAGVPAMTIVTGVGWGGVLAVQLLERHGGCRLHGGLVIDSPIGNARWQGDYYGDLLTLFQWVSPKAYSSVVRTQHGGISHVLLESWEEVGRPFVYQALTPVMAANVTGRSGSYANISFDSPRDLKMVEMLHSLGLNCDYMSDDDSGRFDNPHPQCLFHEVAGALRKAALYMLSFRLAFQGQDPFENYRTLYLPEMFPHLNEEISTRKIADEAALNHQTRYLETSGLLRVPLALMNTRRDPEVPEWQAIEYLRKQKQMCEADGIASRIINDTEIHYFGHAHTDHAGATLSVQLDILYDIISQSRRLDDSSLTQRSWMPKPMRVVDPELASCPFQGEWYREMDNALKKSIKSGVLRTNNKITELLTGQTVPELSDVEKMVPNPEGAANATAASVNAAANSATDAITAAPAVANTATGVAAAGGEAVSKNLNSTANVVGGAANGANDAGARATSNIGEMTGVNPPEVGQPQPPSMPQNSVMQQIQEENAKKMMTVERYMVPSYSEAVEQGKTPDVRGLDSAEDGFDVKSRYQHFVNRVQQGFKPEEFAPPPLPNQPQPHSWTEALLQPIAQLVPKTPFFGQSKPTKQNEPSRMFWNMASGLANSLRRPRNSDDQTAVSTALLELEVREWIHQDKPVTAADALMAAQPIPQVPSYSKLPVVNQQAALLQPPSTQPSLMAQATDTAKTAATAMSAQKTNGDNMGSEWQAIFNGAQAAVHAINTVRHWKMPVSIFKPMELFPETNNTDNFIDRIGSAVERKLEHDLGLTNDMPKPVPANEVSKDNVFPVGRAYAAALAEKKAILSQLHTAKISQAATQPMDAVASQLSAAQAQPVASLPAKQYVPALPAQQPVYQPAQQPVYQPAQQPVYQPAQQPVQQPKYPPAPVQAQSAPTAAQSASPVTATQPLSHHVEQPAQAAASSVMNQQTIDKIMAVPQVKQMLSSLPEIPFLSAPPPSNDHPAYSVDWRNLREDLDNALAHFAVDLANVAVDKIVTKMGRVVGAPPSAVPPKMPPIELPKDLSMSERVQMAFDSKFNQEIGYVLDNLVQSTTDKYGSYVGGMLGSLLHAGSIPAAAVGLSTPSPAETPTAPQVDRSPLGVLSSTGALPAPPAAVPAPASLTEAIDQRVLSMIAPATRDNK